MDEKAIERAGTTMGPWLNRWVAVAYENPENPVLYENVIEGVTAVEQLMDRTLQPETRFDELVTRDMQHRCDGARAWAEYMLGDTEHTLPEVVDLLHGEGTYDAAEQYLQDEHWERDTEWQDAKHQWRRGSINHYRDFTELIQEQVDTIAPHVTEYLQDQLPLDVPEPVFMVSNERNRAQWRPGHLVCLPTKSFPVKQREDGFTVALAHGIQTMFHEIGHGIHQETAAELPYPKDRHASVRLHSAHPEAVAFRVEQEAPTFFSEYADELGINGEGWRAVESSLERLPGVEHAYPRLVQEQEKRGEIPSAEDRLADVYPEPVIPDVLQDRRDIPLPEAISRLEHFAGRRVFSADGQNRPYSVFMKGVWTPQVLPDAMNYFEAYGWTGCEIPQSDTDFL